MKIQSVNFVSNYSQPVKNNSFKGFVGKSKTEVVSFPRWSQSFECPIGTYHTRTILTYYRFLDDTQEELNKFLSENTYIRNIPSNSGSIACTQCNTIEEGSVKIKDVPLTQQLYDSYLEKELSSKNNDLIVKALKKAGLRELLRKS